MLGDHVVEVGHGLGGYWLGGPGEEGYRGGGEGEGAVKIEPINLPCLFKGELLFSSDEQVKIIHAL